MVESDKSEGEESEKENEDEDDEDEESKGSDEELMAHERMEAVIRKLKNEALEAE